jgi:hypothetical protein
MKFDVLGLLAACSYALDCVEAELIKVTNNHSKRVAHMAVCTAEKMGIQGQSLQDLAECALLHDNAVAQYIQEELQNDSLRGDEAGKALYHRRKILKNIPFHNDVSNVILYPPHENADGSEPFGKQWNEKKLLRNKRSSRSEQNGKKKQGII